MLLSGAFFHSEHSQKRMCDYLKISSQYIERRNKIVGKTKINAWKTGHIT